VASQKRRFYTDESREASGSADVFDRGRLALAGCGGGRECGALPLLKWITCVALGKVEQLRETTEDRKHRREARREEKRRQKIREKRRQKRRQKRREKRSEKREEKRREAACSGGLEPQVDEFFALHMKVCPERVLAKLDTISLAT
jgi:hypothetical protein